MDIVLVWCRKGKEIWMNVKGRFFFSVRVGVCDMLFAKGEVMGVNGDMDGNGREEGREKRGGKDI